MLSNCVTFELWESLYFFCAFVEREWDLLRAHLVGAALYDYVCAAGGYACGNEPHCAVGLQEWGGRTGRGSADAPGTFREPT